MRKLSFFLLLATAAAPALAQADNDRGSRRQSGETSEQSESRQQRVENRRSEAREQRASERRSPEAREPRATAAQRSERSQASQQGTTERTRERFQQRRQQAASTQSDATEPVRVRRGREGVTAGETPTNWRQRERRVRTIPDTQPTATQPSTARREAFRDRNRRDYRDGNYTRWSRDNWRRDHRYDWRRHRDRHRSLFRLSFYYDPFGWNYRRWSIGSYLYPSYYGSRFWMNDPWQYRLPPAYGPYRWVRYSNDALLVNIYTGEVVDVMHNFFW